MRSAWAGQPRTFGAYPPKARTMIRIQSGELQSIVLQALIASGFSESNAGALARQAVLAELLGQPSVGISHVFDYVEGLAAGRVDGKAQPVVSRLAPGLLTVDGNRGLPQTGFEQAFETFAAMTRQNGVAILLQHNVTLCGALGTFALQMAEADLVCLAATNGSPLLAGSGSTDAVFCTNPMAFAAPQADGPPLLIDQSSSATAYVNIRKAAQDGKPIPPDWALDKNGNPTRDASAALEGTLLPFAGARGGNIALMVEVLAAGLTGANWSLDAPSYFDGDECPSTGLFLLAIDPNAATGGFAARLAAQLTRLSGDHGVHIPGRAKHRHRVEAERNGIAVDDDLLARLNALAAT